MNKSLATGILTIALTTKAYSQDRPTVKCTAPSAPIASDVTKFVFGKNHLSNASELTLLSSSQANNDCYWQFKYQINPTRREFVLYLGPDHRYMTTALLDLTVDPLAEEKEQQRAVVKALSSTTAATRGPKDAPVTIVEFSDFQCPYCQRLATVLEKDVLPSDPEVKLVFRNFPLPMHPWAEQAAEMTSCAQMQSSAAFWKLHDFIFADQKSFTPANITEKLFAFVDAEPDIKRDVFHSCVDQALSMGPVAKDVEAGKRYGIKATPTFFINGTRIEGYKDAAQLKELIQKAKEGKLVAVMTEAHDLAPGVVAINRQAAANSDACGNAR